MNWKPIKGYPNYIVSDIGMVKNKYGKLLSQQEHTGRYTAYLRIQLHNNGIAKNKRIHRLVAEAFIPNPLNKKQVNHIDDNSFNNCVNNLEWSTHKENTWHRDKIYEDDG